MKYNKKKKAKFKIHTHTHTHTSPLKLNQIVSLLNFNTFKTVCLSKLGVQDMWWHLQIFL